MRKVVISDYYYETIDQEKTIMEAAGFKLEAYRTSTEEELIQRAEDCDALIVQFCPVTRNVIKNLKNCKVIVRYAIGYDTIDIAAADEAGIMVCNVPDYCVDDVSTHAVMLLLACAKRLPVYLDAIHRQQWNYAVAKPLHNFSKSCVGLLGFGSIAQQVAKKLGSFGVDLCAYDPYADPQKAKKLNVRLLTQDELYVQSDMISIHCPLNAQTEKMLNAEAFAKMKPGVVLVNTARGGLIDECALIEALDSGRVAAAGLDVLMQESVSLDHPLMKNPRVLITPHIAWYSDESVLELQKKAAQEVVRVLQNEKPLHMVNHPA